MTEPLPNHVLKLIWAREQLKLLKARIKAWRDGGGYGVDFEPQPDGHTYTICLRASEPPPGISLLAGDVLHSIRSSLDHLAYSLSTAYSGSLKPRAAERIEFPILGTRPMRDKERDRKLGAMDPEAAAVIQELQPHARGDDFAADPLWQLYDLARIDRHRRLDVTDTLYGEIEVGGTNVHTETLTLDYLAPNAELEDGAALGECIVRPIDPGRPMDMEATPPRVVFKGGPLSGEPAVPTLARLGAYVGQTVFPKLTPYLERASTVKRDVGHTPLARAGSDH